MSPLGGRAVGLDIGTSAVRAAQVSGSAGSLSLVKFTQVALPTGAVVDGEIRDTGTVAAAIADLFKRGKLSVKKAVIGVANQRVVVRQVDLPWLEEKEFRSSLRYQVADQLPMPVDSAELDYKIMGDFTNDAGDRMMRVLLIAASTEMVESFVSTAASAGIAAAGVDLSPFAVTRAVSPAARGESGLAGPEAIIDIGAGVTSILVHLNGEPRFVRILLAGGDDATSAVAEELGVSMEEAEAAKLDLARGLGGPRLQRVLDERVEDLVREIRGSIDYYVSQQDGEPVVSVVVSGGGSLTPGLLHSLQQSIRSPLVRAAPLSQVNPSKSGLTQEQVVQVEPVIATALGLAMGHQSK